MHIYRLFLQLRLQQSWSANIFSLHIFACVQDDYTKRIDKNFISFSTMKAMKIFYVGNSTYHNFCISKENTPLVFLLSHFLIINVLSCFRKIYCKQKDYDILYVLCFIGLLRLVLRCTDISIGYILETYLYSCVLIMEFE